MQTKFLRLKTALESNISKPDYAREFYNSYNLVNILSNKISMQIRQLNPSVSMRSKRGLLNGLGSIIRTITGNLDQSDAERYDRAISTLSDNQLKLKSIVKQQVTLLQRSIKAFENNTQILEHNQVVLESRVMQIEQTLKSIELRNTHAYDYFLIQMTISQITTAFQVIYDILERLEVAITFAKLNTFHNSITDPKDLLDEVKSISIHLVRTRLPFKPILENILLFEKIINIKSYSKQNLIVFILEVPIVETEFYNYYHLYPLPTPDKYSFKTIVPRSKYLILNEQSFKFSDTRCQEVANNEFICHEANPVKIRNEEEVPCEIQMLKFVNNITSCQHVLTEIKNVKTQKLENNQWILIAPENIVAIQKCGVNSDNIPLKGTYVLELNQYCEVRIKDTKIKSYQNSQNIFKPIELPKLDINLAITESSIINFKPLKLDSVNLDEVKYIQGALDIQNKNLDNISNTPIHFNSISVWTIIVYIFMFILIVYAVYYLYIKKIRKVPNSQNDHEPSGIELVNPVCPRVLH